ncbi:MAG: RHS repeat-associated core domain-containing protein [Leptolyngbyaceae cyanobacterium]
MGNSRSESCKTGLHSIVYDSFGQVTSETDPAFDFRFGYTGRERDEESGMLYYRARYFNPAVGTFVGEDPLGFDAGDANLYRYVFNSPTNYTDPSGMQTDVMGSSGGIGPREVAAIATAAAAVAWRVNPTTSAVQGIRTGGHLYKLASGLV